MAFPKYRNAPTTSSVTATIPLIPTSRKMIAMPTIRLFVELAADADSERVGSDGPRALGAGNGC
jgi:hypothetical protein